MPGPENVYRYGSDRPGGNGGNAHSYTPMDVTQLRYSRSTDQSAPPSRVGNEAPYHRQFNEAGYPTPPNFHARTTLGGDGRNMRVGGSSSQEQSHQSSRDIPPHWSQNLRDYTKRDLSQHESIAAIVFTTDQGRFLYAFRPKLKNQVPIERENADCARMCPNVASMQRVENPTGDYNCHGFTFGRQGGWLEDNEVPHIINDNGFTPVQWNQTRPGDVVIYKDSNKQITHSGIVDTVNQWGQPQSVRSKFGAGSLFKHSPDAVPSFYGQPSVYRSNRNDGRHLHLTNSNHWPEQPQGSTNPVWQINRRS
jgi:hypothetical protein